MSYQVLARKWRPRTFHELVGQEHIVQALTNALNHNRLHHAFLFTGTRGVGKTTISRILAKSLNCETGVTATPCGVCSACREIDEGRFVDLIEVDAASRTGVDDTRELLENVPYAPARGRYKVYLIDEVHMFSKSSFNALLKTLEEPPPHVKFLLATTDPQRLPVTILSRCLQFNLKRLPAALIARHLDHVLEHEGIAREPAALALLARAGEGSMRDALSLLDQAIAFGGGQVKQDDVQAMLGTIDRRAIFRLLEALAAQDAQSLLEQIAELDERAPDYGGVLADLVTLLQRIAVVQQVPTALRRDDWTAIDADAIQQLAERLTPEDVQLFYQIGLVGRRDLPLSPDARSGFEMILLRMLCFRPATEEGVLVNTASPAASKATAAVANASSGPKTSTSRASVAPRSHESDESSRDSDHAIPSLAHPVTTVSTEPSESPAHSAPVDAWHTLIQQLSLRGFAQQLALHCTVEKQTEDALYLLLNPQQAHLNSPAATKGLQNALHTHYGRAITVKIRIATSNTATPADQYEKQQVAKQKAAYEAIVRDPHVQALRDTFDAQVQSESVVPMDDD